MPLEQHPVPQQISSYQFRLVGDMTLRQFGLLASGCIIGLVLHALPLADLFKWPLIIFSVFSGFALAFLPIQERSLEKWLAAFIKAVFSPSQYVWEKQVRKPIIFETPPKKVMAQRAIPPTDRKRLTRYLETLPAEPKSPLDQEEENFVKKAINMFQLTKVPTAAQFQTPPPSIGTRVEKPIVKKPKPAPKPKPQPKVAKAPPPKKKPLPLPKKPTQAKKPAVEAKFGPGLPFPEPLSQPNTLVGMVLDKNGKIIEGAIIEIRNAKGVPVRALKTNKLGQFRSVTPLDDGEYEIEMEKEGYLFDVLKIKMSGAIIEPLEIRAKGTTSEPAQNT